MMLRCTNFNKILVRTMRMLKKTKLGQTRQRMPRKNLIEYSVLVLSENSMSKDATNIQSVNPWELASSTI